MVRELPANVCGQGGAADGRQKLCTHFVLIIAREPDGLISRRQSRPELTTPKDLISSDGLTNSGILPSSYKERAFDRHSDDTAKAKCYGLYFQSEGVSATSILRRGFQSPPRRG